MCAWQVFELAPAGTADSDTGIAAVSRIPGHLEVWWVGANSNSVEGAYWYEGTPWARYLLAPDLASGDGLAAVSRIPGSMEVWWLTFNQSINDAYWYDTAARAAGDPPTAAGRTAATGSAATGSAATGAAVPGPATAAGGAQGGPPVPTA
ncbi:hypothetical protein [Streptomyces sp. TS71-3]|uniref:hypothetical protein n=1 Tax=Streptomyces sp. TS71-3 TaxID=2733862 RepID=UPI001B077B3A|nr:hypothetical protein [Streptomyces sp. TS71-3]GHJ37407.1 hypothetical protein Sm713_30160 [Streptomyces sp. TS71-3]